MLTFGRSGGDWLLAKRTLDHELWDSHTIKDDLVVDRSIKTLLSFYVLPPLGISLITQNLTLAIALK